MKSNIKCRVIILIAAIVGVVEVANAFYDPSVQRWLNRDPLGDHEGVAYQATDLEAADSSDGGFLDAWINVNGNLHRGIGNNPINRLDAFGLTDNSLDACAKSNPGELGKMAAREAHEGRLYSAQKYAEQQARDALTKKLRQGFGNGLKGSRNIDPNKLKQLLTREELKQAQEIAKQGMRKAADLLKKTTDPKTRKAAQDAFETVVLPKNPTNG